jgi:3-dehydroquinate synthase
VVILLKEDRRGRWNFGHWVADRLEYLSDYRLRHGEAVAIGIAVDVIYCRLANYLTGKESSRILAFDMFSRR